MDIGKSFTYVFEDERWINKVLVGGLFILASVVVVGIPFILGYILQVMRNVMKGVERPLPEWDDLGGKFKEGLILAIIYIVWLAPIWILWCIQAASSALATQSYEMASAVGVLSICLSCLMGLYGIFLAVLLPAIFIRFANNPVFKSGFEFSEIFQFTKENIGNVIIAVLLGIAAAMVGSLGTILCVVGVLFTYFWAYMVQAHLYGQVYLKRKGAPVEPIDPAPAGY